MRATTGVDRMRRDRGRLSHVRAGPFPAGGEVRPIIGWGTPLLHREVAHVWTFDQVLASLVRDLVATLHAAGGAGLAANQIGVDRKVFVFDCPDADGRRATGVVCNPVLTLPAAGDRRLEAADEGCLSLPGVSATCPRPDRAHVRGVDEHGDPVEFTGTGQLARCFQHEVDHLLGIVFGDRLPEPARRRLLQRHRELADRSPPNWPNGPDVGDEPRHTPVFGNDGRSGPRSESVNNDAGG